MNAINWLISKSTTKVYAPQDFDGQIVETVSYFFNGTLPTRMYFEVKAMADRGTLRGFTGTTDKGIEWSATFGDRHSTKDTVVFTANEYIIS